ncbi:DNA replication licensing factor MCM3 [Vairimorpha necatrix]|uniref:DNA replication licensing factor MCM3 n=1 Tax=Vairimorpha necatrix TaxID=6039 RepID=A0AAX4J931_9MICR
MNIADPIEEFKNFIDEYKNTSEKDYYEILLKTSSPRVIFNMNDIRNYNTNLASLLINDPATIVPQIEDLLNQISQKDIKFGIKGSFGEYKLTPRTLISLFIGKLICITGIVTNCSTCRPKIVKSVHYNNTKSSFVQKEYRDSTMITKLPITNTVYPTRDTDGSILNTEYGLSDYVDYQTFNLQEMPEDAPCGQLPRSVECIVSHDLVDKIKPGDRITCYGIYKSLSFGNTTEFPSKFKNVLICNNIDQLKKTEIKTTKSNTIDYKDITKYIAPSIWGHDKIKLALALMLVGGNEIIMKNGSKIRGDINILLVGDPSTAKSQLLRFIYNFNEISVATTGKGSSGVGLTAAVVIDKETGDKRLEAGAMVLADRGIVCIDEFDKMNDLDRVAIHEVMEQQTVTISKAGIHTTLNARCSVLAAANPIYGMYRESRKPSENIRLPESIMTRFDLIFVVLDKSDVVTDSLISEHVVRSHSVFVQKEEEDSSGFKEYIDECRKLKPVLSREASKMIIEEYTNLRQIKNKKEQIVSITPRMLETMIRLSTAHAKLRLSEITEVSDVESAISLLNSTLFQQISKETKRPKNEVDKEYDIDQEIQIVENQNAKKDYVIDLLYEIRLSDESLTNISLDEIYSRVSSDLEISKEDVNDILEELSLQEIIYYENNTVIFIND